MNFFVRHVFFSRSYSCIFTLVALFCWFWRVLSQFCLFLTADVWTSWCNQHVMWRHPTCHMLPRRKHFGTYHVPSTFSYHCLKLRVGAGENPPMCLITLYCKWEKFTAKRAILLILLTLWLVIKIIREHFWSRNMTFLWLKCFERFFFFLSEIWCSFKHKFLF